MSVKWTGHSLNKHLLSTHPMLDTGLVLLSQHSESAGFRPAREESKYGVPREHRLDAVWPCNLSSVSYCRLSPRMSHHAHCRCPFLCYCLPPPRLKCQFKSCHPWKPAEDLHFSSALKAFNAHLFPYLRKPIEHASVLRVRATTYDNHFDFNHLWDLTIWGGRPLLYQVSLRKWSCFLSS